MLLTPPLKALLAVLLLCGGQSLVLAYPLGPSWPHPSGFLSRAVEDGIQYPDFHDEPLPPFDIESDYKQFHQGSGFGYPTLDQGSANGNLASFGNLDPYGKDLPTPERRLHPPGLQGQHQAPAPFPPRQELPTYHGSGSGGSPSDESLDSYLAEILNVDPHPVPPDTGGLDHSPALAPPRQGHTLSNLGRDGTQEWTQHSANQHVPAGYMQSPQLELAPPSSRKRPNKGGTSRSHTKPQPTQTAIESREQSAREKLSRLDRIQDTSSAARFERVEGELGFLSGTVPQRQKIEERIRLQAAPGFEMEWLPARPKELPKYKAKRNSLIDSIHYGKDFKWKPPFRPYFLNDHLIYFSSIQDYKDHMDVFAMTHDGTANPLVDKRYEPTYVGTLKFEHPGH